LQDTELARISQEAMATGARPRQGRSRRADNLGAASLLAHQQDKRSGSYQQGKQNTGDEHALCRSSTISSDAGPAVRSMIDGTGTSIGHHHADWRNIGTTCPYPSAPCSEKTWSEILRNRLT